MPELTVPVAAIGRAVGALHASDERAGLPSGEALGLRALKVVEEMGEVVGALSGMAGQNPCKGVTHDPDDLISELFDVALTALVAAASLRGWELLPRQLHILGRPGHRPLAHEVARLAGVVGKVADAVSSRDEGTRDGRLAELLKMSARWALSIADGLAPDCAERFVAHVEVKTSRVVEAVGA